VYASLEESVEMIGASLIIFTLLRYFEVAIPEVRLVARSKSGNRDLGNTGGAQ
jgi:hypothetical protein